MCEGLMRSKEWMEYSHKLHLFDPYNNIILIIMVINAFNTTLYSGWNIYQVSIFFIKRKPTIRTLKVNIKKKLEHSS